MKKSSFVLFSLVLILLAYEAKGLIPYSRSVLDMLLPSDDPFKILEQSPLAIPKGVETLALARADWLETDQAHVISLDIPGMKKEDIKIEVEENNVLRISGERVSEEEKEGDKWHRVERTSGRFWRQFRLPSNANLDSVKAHLENGVLKITVPKIAQVKKEARVVNIVEKASNDDLKSIKASKDEM